MQILKTPNQIVLQKYNSAELSAKDADGAFEALGEFLGLLLEIHEYNEGGLNEDQ